MIAVRQQLKAFRGSVMDATVFHLYLGPETDWCRQLAALTQTFPTPRHAVDYIMDTFSSIIHLPRR